MKNKIGILIESDYYEDEIFYYRFRFKEAGYEVHFLSRLWGNDGITFTGHEYRAPLYCNESFEYLSDVDLDEYAAVIVPAGIVADRLRYTENVNALPPACAFMQRLFARKDIVKGVICHGLWLLSPVSELVKGRKMTVHNNLLGDARNYGVDYVDADVMVDDDLISARTGGHCYLLASEMLKVLLRRKKEDELGKLYF
ncbi:DJ-1/PfpI family protein [Phocaeicola sartorii]|uniref:DJ-1/PfpI family protein n=1 Tax=Phocaeicola sartorii TaxID=671267 RepID=UPI001F5705B3|nr:DJ-1/PfpI family protein [Phocaeicola sartorii]